MHVGRTVTVGACRKEVSTEVGQHFWGIGLLEIRTFGDQNFGIPALWQINTLEDEDFWE